MAFRCTRFRPLQAITANNPTVNVVALQDPTHISLAPLRSSSAATGNASSVVEQVASRDQPGWGVVDRVNVITVALARKPADPETPPRSAPAPAPPASARCSAAASPAPDRRAAASLRRWPHAPPPHPAL